MFKAGDFAATGVSSYGLIMGERRVGLCTLGTLLMRGSLFLGSPFRVPMYICAAVSMYFSIVFHVFFIFHNETLIITIKP
jgi:hypothetical protein